MPAIIAPKNSPDSLMETRDSIVATLHRVARKIGATIIMEPDWNCVGQIAYPSGVRRYFKFSTLDLNTMAASEVARDKDYARFFLKNMGYPVPIGKSFLSESWAKAIKAEGRGIDDAWSYAQKITGMPVFVKPNSKSRGVGVSKAHNRREFYSAARAALKEDKVILVEQAVKGRDYRLVVLDGKVISAYERIPLKIIGDGKSSISALLDTKEENYIKDGRTGALNRSDFRITKNMRRLKMNFDSVPEQGKTIQLLENANLSTGGTSVDVTKAVHPDSESLAANVARDMGLRLVGVDLMIDGLITEPLKQDHHWIIEINSAPGLDHYASMGQRQKQIVEDLYLQVIVAMERAHESVKPHIAYNS